MEVYLALENADAAPQICGEMVCVRGWMGGCKVLVWMGATTEMAQ